jgi:hypothetical protein
MRKSTLVSVITTLAMSTLSMSLFVVTTTTTGPFNILPANADRDEKFSQTWESEEAGASSFRSCEKPDECKGIQVNKEARDICNDFSDSDSKCKLAHD